MDVVHTVAHELVRVGVDANVAQLLFDAGVPEVFDLVVGATG